MNWLVEFTVADTATYGHQVRHAPQFLVVQADTYEGAWNIARGMLPYMPGRTVRAVNHVLPQPLPVEPPT